MGRDRSYSAPRLGVMVSVTCVLALIAISSCSDNEPVDIPRCPDCRFEETPPCHRLVCNEETAQCEAEPLADDTPCDSLESCSYGDSCRNGECRPGTEIDCPRAPVCQDVTCDPVSDVCIFEPADEEESCSLPCLLDGVCVTGRCVGEETDCSWLGDGCNAGRCHPEIGDCYLEPIALGMECVATDTACATARCDGMGSCIDEPFADGTACDDNNRCTGDDSCSAGACGGTVITACTTGDRCCPAGCVDDLDCCTALGPGTDPDAWRFEGVARYDNDAGHVTLTPARNWNWGQIWLQHDVSQPFVARFRYRAAMSDESADGMVFMFYKDPDYEPRGGGELGFDAGRGCREETEGTGYGIEIDNWANGCDDSGNHIALIHETIGGHLAVVEDPRTHDGEWHEMVITVDEGSVAVELDGDAILSWEGTIDRTFGGLGVSAATGGANDEYVVDDIEISCLE